MAGRGHPDMVPDCFGPVMRHPLGTHPQEQPQPIELLERRLAGQHEELQRLVVDNRRLRATHVALREELAGTQQELQKMHTQMAIIQGNKGQQFKGLIDKTTKMEDELQSGEQQHTQDDAQSLTSMRQDLTGQVQQLTAELHRAHQRLQQIPALHAEMNGLRQELHSARNLNVTYGASPVAGRAGYDAPRGGGSQKPVTTENAPTYAVGPVKQLWSIISYLLFGRGGYDVPRRGGSEMPVAPVNGNPYGAEPTPARGGYDGPGSDSKSLR